MCLAASRSRAGVYVNANNDTYACTDGTVIVVQNDYAKEYNRAYKILRVMRRGDVRIMRKCAQKVWKTFGNRAKNGMCVVARTMASARRGIGYEELIVHRLYTKNGRIASFVRGQLKSMLNTDQRRRALIIQPSPSACHAGGVSGRYVRKVLCV